METFKTIIAWLLSPFVIGTGLQLLGFLCLKLGRRRATRAFLVIGTAILVIGGLPVLTYDANRNRSLIHEPFQTEQLADPFGPALIVVLGGGFDPDSWLSPTSRLGSAVTARLVEGVRVYRLLPNSRLLVSFAGDAGTPEEKRATLLELATILELDPDRLEILTEAESTADEAEMTAAIRSENERVLIATSANHMPRAMITFADLGLDPIAAPTEFHYPRKESRANKPWKQWIPSSHGHGQCQLWLYESVAILGQRLGII